jgi:hypothetical protein
MPEKAYGLTMTRSRASSVLTVRIGSDLERSFEKEARRRNTSKSELVRELLVHGLGCEAALAHLAREARVQSLRVSGRRSEEEALDFLEHAADTRGWK